ncbi:hypothetical protein GCM10022243_38180 [Saccharothrix violaceirubra]|uniref:Uncharacterized protein n=1 Tax=Saccharothrix violaceirubra TaxID=413306 RepID=A0A7W7T481_9PSEU|nr:hypothetical protein [Saccharothrix violaceirubra]MBB4966268.1 hypothetical protein [Saccharothrix violaceirubra]
MRGTVEVVRLGFDSGQGRLRITTSSYADPERVRYWEETLAPYCRIESIPGRPVPMSALSLLAYQRNSVLLYRFGGPEDVARNASVALVGGHSTLLDLAPRMSTWDGWAGLAVDDTSPVDVEWLWGQVAAGPLPRPAAEVEPAVAGLLAEVLRAPRGRFSVLDLPQDQVVPALFLIREVVGAIADDGRKSRYWSFSSYEVRDDESGTSPEFVFLPGERQFGPAADRVQVARRDDLHHTLATLLLTRYRELAPDLFQAEIRRATGGRPRLDVAIDLLVARLGPGPTATGRHAVAAEGAPEKEPSSTVENPVATPEEEPEAADVPAAGLRDLIRQEETRLEAAARTLTAAEELCRQLRDEYARRQESLEQLRALAGPHDGSTTVTPSAEPKPEDTIETQDEHRPVDRPPTHTVVMPPTGPAGPSNPPTHFPIQRGGPMNATSPPGHLFPVIPSRASSMSGETGMRPAPVDATGRPSWHELTGSVDHNVGRREPEHRDERRFGPRWHDDLKKVRRVLLATLALVAILLTILVVS